MSKGSSRYCFYLQNFLTWLSAIRLSQHKKIRFLFLYSKLTCCYCQNANTYPLPFCHFFSTAWHMCWYKTLALSERSVHELCTCRLQKDSKFITENLAIHVLSTLSVFIYLKLTTTMISFQVQWYPRCQLVRNAFNSKLLKRTRRRWLFTTWNLFGPFQDSLWSTRSVKIAMKSHWLDCFCTLRDQLRSPK